MMVETVLSRSVRMICAGGIALGMSAAIAQEAAPMQRIEVTGSRISSPGAESPAPMQVISAAEIAASGVTNLQELLLKNPTLGTPGISRTNSNFSTSSAGVASVDLRNLGSARTLVLVNGRRFVSGVPGSSTVDMNSIPTDFIERVEILTGGASSVYGSDAVAGVVNIVLKRNFNGVLFDSSFGKSSKNDDTKKKLALTFGTTSADGASNVMGHLGYSKQGAVYSRDRDISAVDQTTLAGATGLVGDIFKVRQPFFSSYNPAGTFLTDHGYVTFDAAGKAVPVNTNGTGGATPTGYNRSANRLIAVPTERMLFSSTGNYALTPDHSAFFEGTYASTKVSTRIEPLPFDSGDGGPASMYADGQVPAEFAVPGVVGLVRNPLIPDAIWNKLDVLNADGARNYWFKRRMSDIANRSSLAERDTFRVATGLKGSIKDWNYETYYVYGASKEAQTSQGGINVLNFRNALEVVPGPNGPVCRDATAVVQGCVPANIFGENKISAAAAKYIASPSSLSTKTTQKLAGGSISGEPFMLPAGALGVAVGYEWREEESSTSSDILTQLGLNGGNALPDTYGKFSVKEFFVETKVPLLKNKPFVKSLDFSGAFRSGDYSTVGKTNSWNAGMEWSPVADIKLRATRSLSTRAPNINELYSPPSQTFPSVTDPCTNVTATSTGARDVACRAAPGVNANIAANGKFTLTQADEQGVSGYDRGNADVGAEKGRSTTAGVVWTPRSIPMLNKFTFTMDYFDIKIADGIVSTPRDYALQNCYGGPATLCNFITRRPAATASNSAGSLQYIDSGVSNSGGVSTKGLDITSSWADKVGPGRLSAHVAYTYVKSHDTRPLPNAPIDSAAGEVGFSKNKASMTLGYRLGAFNLSATTTHIGKACLDDQYLSTLSLTVADQDAERPAGACSAKVSAKTYNDFQLTYAAHKNVELYFGLDNAFNVKPPFIPTGVTGNVTGAETDAGTYDAIGRRYYAGVRFKM
jgi:iron complex outermembrane receptor protein